MLSMSLNQPGSTGLVSRLYTPTARQPNMFPLDSVVGFAYRWDRQSLPGTCCSLLRHHRCMFREDTMWVSAMG